MWTGIYAYGHPIQYAYLKSDLALWSVQTAYASRPWQWRCLQPDIHSHGGSCSN